MKCDRCGKEVKNHSFGCYTCEHCGFSIHDLVYRESPQFISIPNTEPKVYQQGWVCPKCGGVYSPSQGCCPNCTPAKPIQFTCDTGKPAFNNFTITTGTTSQDLCSGVNFDVRYNVAPQTKRGRGRPRIHPVKTEKRPVGRPRKVVNK